MISIAHLSDAQRMFFVTLLLVVFVWSKLVVHSLLRLKRPLLLLKLRLQKVALVDCGMLPSLVLVESTLAAVWAGHLRFILQI